jgi:hypothetical protein
MLWQILATRRMATLALTVTLLAGVGGSGFAQSNYSDSNGLRIEGTWLVQVTLRNCATGAPIGSVNSIVTFAPGGTVIETPGGASAATGQRSDGQGFWTHAAGRTYTQRFVALIRFDTPPNPPTSPGFLAGWQTVTHTVELADADNLSSSGTNEFFDMNGNSYRRGCSTAVGQRFE